jgi:transposase-like zinc-binding protein
MNRPSLEVADLVRPAGRGCIERSRKWITGQHLKVLRAIARCRTAPLGGHLDECIDCAYRPPISYNSCRDRHCPKCQATARDRWLEARRKELLPTRYVHVVFTLPHELAPLALQNKKILYHRLLQTSAKTLLEVARDPQHLGAEIGFFAKDRTNGPASRLFLGIRTMNQGASTRYSCGGCRTALPAAILMSTRTESPTCMSVLGCRTSPGTARVKTSKSARTS